MVCGDNNGASKPRDGCVVDIGESNMIFLANCRQ